MLQIPYQQKILYETEDIPALTNRATKLKYFPDNYKYIY